jgi:hypothetical protein
VRSVARGVGTAPSIIAERVVTALARLTDE